jgi:hypothetical protein
MVSTGVHLESDIGSVWFSFFLTSFSENLAMGRIWVSLGLRAEENKIVHEPQDL